MQRHVAAAAILIMLGNVVSRLLGLVREQVMAALFGATGATDAFVAASAVPMIVYDLLIGGAISAALVPVFVDHRDDSKRLWEVASALLTLAALTLCGLALVLAAAAPLLISLLGTGFDPAQQEQAVAMVRVMLVAVVLQGLAGVLMAVLYAQQRFAAPALTPAIYNGAIIVGALALHPWLGVGALVAGVLLGAAGQLGLQLLTVRRLHYRPMLGLDREEVRLALRLYAPVGAGMLVTIVGIVIDRNLASRLDDGSMTVMGYATRLIQFPLGLVGVAVSSAVLPTLSAHASTDDTARLDEYRSTLISGTRLILFLMLPALVGLVLLHEPLVRLVFERGQFTTADTSRTSLALLAYAPQLPFTALDQLLIVAFYARKDTRTPVLVGVVTVLLYLGSALLLIGPLGVTGLALANAIQNSAHGLILFGLLQASLGSLMTPALAGYLARVIGACAAMALAVIGLHRLLGPMATQAELLLGLLCLTTLALVVYVAVATLLRLPEPRLLFNAARRASAPV